MRLPEGTVSFLFTDIEGSTQLLSRRPKEYASALLRLDVLLREAVEQASGVVFETVGDAVYAAFARPSDAVAGALSAQRALDAEDWGALGPLRMRMSVHTGEVELRGDHYFGAPLYRCARLMAIGHGGQVLVSATTAPLVFGRLPPAAELREMGLHRLKDFPEPEVIFQLVYPGLRPDFPPLRSLGALPNNLPTQITPFVGRHEERRGVRAALTQHRLVTLTGSGGSGKTRLALEAAGELLADYPGGVWLIELAPLSEPNLVPQAVAAALHLREEPDRSVEVTLTAALRERTTLLVLDNCEHLVDAVARLVAEILRGTPDTRVLATSREPLGLGGETVLPVAPLQAADAAYLFVERARAVSATFSEDVTNASVSSICRRLDGIPLAIELAASRARAFSVDEIERRLNDRFRFLDSGNRSVLPRQRTLHALIDWSYDLLEPRERKLLASLSVFSGGFDLEAAERICATGDESGDVAIIVGRLVDRSLVEAQPPRYRLLDTIRAFGEEQLGPDNTATLRDAHLAWFTELAVRAEAELTGPGQTQWLKVLEDQHENMRAALGWAVARHGNEAGLQLAGALSSFWATRGYWSEGRAWLGRLLAAAPTDDPRQKATRAKALDGAGRLAYHQGDYNGAAELCEAALAVQRELRDKPGMIDSFMRLGLVAGERGDFTRAATLFEKGLAAAREIGDTRQIASALGNLGLCAWHAGDNDRAWSLDEEVLALQRAIGNTHAIGIALNNLGTVAQSLRDYARAASLYEESLTISRELGDKRGIAVKLRNLGEIAYALGDHALANARYAESLTLMRELGLKGTIPGLLDVLASVAAREGMPKRATILFGAAAELRESLGATRRLADWPDYDESLAIARAGQDETSFNAAWSEGRTMAIDHVIAFALGSGDA